MKTPTTPFSIEVQEKAQITRSFLESEGWELFEEKPLFEKFTHHKNSSLRCSIGLYGEFAITELHWMNQTPEKEFSTINSNLTTEDYHAIIKLLNITIKP